MHIYQEGKQLVIADGKGVVWIERGEPIHCVCA